MITSQTAIILWHCTAGKDRAGFASVILEELLDVRREEIMSEYLASNNYLMDEIQTLYEMVASSMNS